MKEEFDLSEKMVNVVDSDDILRLENVFKRKDVKEFIKRQIEEIDRDLYYEKEQGLLHNKSYFRALHKVRDKLVKDAGDKLI